MQPAAYVRIDRTADGFVLLNTQTGEILGANAIGARVWTLLESGYTTEGVSQTIASECGANPDQVHRDVSAFISELVRRKLFI
jgi:hypothetical protein